MFTKILLASDGSECALKAAAVAATVASKFAARLTIINVFEPYASVGPYGEIVYTGLDDTYTAEMKDYAISHAGRIVDEMNVPYQCRQETGQPAAEIVRVAAEEHFDLIVLGSRGLSGFKSLVLGSVSDTVTHHAHCPVLIVK
ncbi:MAG: universal stress protein [Janthinobacterium lividum]